MPLSCSGLRNKTVHQNTFKNLWGEKKRKRKKPQLSAFSLTRNGSIRRTWWVVFFLFAWLALFGALSFLFELLLFDQLWDWHTCQMRSCCQLYPQINWDSAHLSWQRICTSGKAGACRGRASSPCHCEPPPAHGDSVGQGAKGCCSTWVVGILDHLIHHTG